VNVRLNKTLSVCPFLGGIAWLSVMFRSKDYSLKWLVLLYLWPLVGLIGLIPLRFALNEVPEDQWGTSTNLLVFFCILGVLAECVLWPGRLIGTFRYWVRNELTTSEGHWKAHASYGNYFKWFLINKFGGQTEKRAGSVHPKDDMGEVGAIATAGAIASGAERLQISVQTTGAAETPSGANDTGSKKVGLFRRILLYLGVAVVGFGAGAAAGEAIDQAFGSRKRRRANAARFNAGEILAAGGRAALTALVVILFVIFYPIYYVASAGWHAYIDDSALSVPMDPYGSHKGIIYHRYFPDQKIGVIAISDGCISIFDLQRKKFIEVKTMKHSLWSGKEYETVTQCLQVLKDKFRSQDEYLDEVEKISIWLSRDGKAIDVQAIACYLCGTSAGHKIFARLKLADFGIGSSRSRHVNGRLSQVKLLKVRDDGVVVTQDKKNGRTIRFDLHTVKKYGIADWVLSPSGRLLAVTVRRPMEDTFWNSLFNDCEITVSNNRSSSYPHTAPCEYSTEVWDIKSQKLLRSIYWPPGIKSMAFTPGERYVATVAEPTESIFAEPTLKLWEIVPVSE
jgi:predicted Zn-ribbon and HTH transcriptional regulator